MPVQEFSVEVPPPAAHGFGVGLPGQVADVGEVAAVGVGGVGGEDHEADLGEGLLDEGLGGAAGLGAQFGAVDAPEAEAPGARLMTEAEVDDGDEGVAVDDAVDPGCRPGR